MIFKYYSPAKLNLFLKIYAKGASAPGGKNKRKDGFHNIETIFERINLCDEITISINNSGKIKVSSDKKISSQKSNLAYKAADIIKNEFNISQGIDIKIKKIIPIGAGLGGASSNAATVLTALNSIFKLNISQRKLIGLGKCLGSDVPFFLFDKSFAYAFGRGEILKPILNVGKIKFWHILIAPCFKNLTKDMYRRFDDYLRLTKQNQNDKIKCPKIDKINKKGLKDNLFNSFELIAGSKINKIKRELSQLNVKYTLMSGSGSAIFGIIGSRKEANRLFGQLRNKRLGQIFVVTTY